MPTDGEVVPNSYYLLFENWDCRWIKEESGQAKPNRNMVL
jgi:hypothetical protein